MSAAATNNTHDNYTVLVEHGHTRMLACEEGWTPARDRALPFKQGAHAVGYCLARNYTEVNLLYERNARVVLRVPLFNGDKATKVVPTAGISPATSTFGESRSGN